MIFLTLLKLPNHKLLFTLLLRILMIIIIFPKLTNLLKILRTSILIDKSI